MTRKTNTRKAVKNKLPPLTLQELAEMDRTFELSKSATIKARGIEPEVTAAVTENAEQAAYNLLGQSDKFVVGTTDAVRGAMRETFSFGQMAGKMEGYRKGILTPRNAGEQRALDQAPAIGKILSEVFRETRKAVSKHGPMHSGHEGYAVIKEELDELWDEVKADRFKQASAREEAIQVAAMAVRYVLDLDPR